MQQNFSQIICEALNEGGMDVLKNHQQFSSWLRDLSEGQYKKECNFIANYFDEKILSLFRLERNSPRRLLDEAKRNACFILIEKHLDKTTTETIVSLVAEGVRLHLGWEPSKNDDDVASSNSTPKSVSKAKSSNTTSPKDKKPITPSPASASRQSSTPSQGSTQKTASKRKTKKRGVAVLAAAFVIVAAVVIANGLGLFETLDAMVSGVTPKASVEEYSWEELAAISDEIAQAEDEDAALEVAKRYNLVNEDGTLDGTQTKSVTLSDGTVTSVQIAGFVHDDKSDGSGKAGITFIFTDAIAEKSMNSGRRNYGGWESSDMRSWLSSDGKALLPEELQDVLVAVDKFTNNVGYVEDGVDVSSVITTTSDELWLFSYVELVGELDESYFSDGREYLAAIYSAEGSQYKLFSDCDVVPYNSNSGNSFNNAILAKTYQDDSYGWWERSPSPSTSSSFIRVTSVGRPYQGIQANTSFAVVPGFCISSSTSASTSEEDSEVWGPTDRETFTWSSPASYITFNSITDNPTLGDERNFVRVREAGVGTYSDSVEIEAGKTYEIYIYYHNNASSSLNESGEGVAQNVTLSSDLPSRIDSGYAGMVSATISSTNSTPVSVWDAAYLVNKTGDSLYLSYVHDSAVITNSGSASGSILDAGSLFSENGAFLAYSSNYWGIIPGCNDYAGYVVYQVVVESADSSA